MKGLNVPSGTLGGIPDGLRTPLLDEYNKVARNYREARWEPTELNGGKFCEIVYSIIKGYVDGSFPASPSKPANMVDACRGLEQAAGFPRSIRIQIPRLILGLYEIRNNRNVGHVGGDVDPSHMDATLVFSMVRWIMAELVRIFHNVPPDEASDLVEALTERTLPILWKVAGRTRVLNSTLGTNDKMLVLLYGSAEPLTAKQIAASIEYKNVSRFRTTVVTAAHRRDLLHFDRASDVLTISPIGIRYVEQNVPLDI